MCWGTKGNPGGFPSSPFCESINTHIHILDPSEIQWIEINFAPLRPTGFGNFHRAGRGKASFLRGGMGQGRPFPRPIPGPQYWVLTANSKVGAPQYWLSIDSCATVLTTYSKVGAAQYWLFLSSWPALLSSPWPTILAYLFLYGM